MNSLSLRSPREAAADRHVATVTAGCIRHTTPGLTSIGTPARCEPRAAAVGEPARQGLQSSFLVAECGAATPHPGTAGRGQALAQLGGGGRSSSSVVTALSERGAPPRGRRCGDTGGPVGATNIPRVGGLTRGARGGRFRALSTLRSPRERRTWLSHDPLRAPAGRRPRRRGRRVPSRAGSAHRRPADRAFGQAWPRRVRDRWRRGRRG